MKRFLWILAVVILCGVGFWLLRSPQEPSSIALPESLAITSPSPTEEPSPLKVNPPAKQVLSPEKTQVIAECLSDHFLAKYFLSGEFDLKGLLQKESQVEWLVDQEILHYQTQDGDFRVVSFPSQADEAKEPLRLFKVDTDGYPTPIKPPAEWLRLNDKEIFERIKNQFKIVKNQKRARLLIPSSLQMELELENEEIKTLSVNIQDKNKTRFLGCDLRNTTNKPCVCR